jgi:CcmD family protein
MGEGSLVYLFAALAIVWAVIIGYLVVLGGRLSALRRELDALKRQHSWDDDTHDERTT